MRSRFPWFHVAAAPLMALLRHELRVLCQNRMACLILLSLPTTVLVPRTWNPPRANPPRETCYIVYWKEDAFVRHLKSALRHSAPDGPPIAIVPVSQLAGRDGLIEYPAGSHSIQLRPLDSSVDGPDRRLVWYWYSGGDAGRLWSSARWFWGQAREHYGAGGSWEERVSALEPGFNLPGLGERRLRVDDWMTSRQLEIVLLWASLHFAACFLPTLSLAEARAGRVLDTLVLSPLGSAGVARAQRVFYGLLAAGLCVLLVLALEPLALLRPALWLAVLGGVSVYLGVAYVIASRSRSVGAASTAGLVYLILSGAAYGAVSLLPAPLGPRLAPWSCAEAAIAGMLSDVFVTVRSPTASSVLPLVFWAVLWQLAGRWCYRRLWQ
jgi:hypothetical protein